MEDRAKKSKKRSSLFDRILDVANALGIVMITFTMLTICAHVGMRYIFGKPMNWVIDISSILLLYITFLGAAFLLRAEGHVAVDFIVALIKPLHNVILQIVNSVLCALSCLIITVYGIIETVSVWKLDMYVDMPLEPPKWIVIIIIPLGSIMLFIQFIRRIRGFTDELISMNKRRKIQ